MNKCANTIDSRMKLQIYDKMHSLGQSQIQKENCDIANSVDQNKFNVD